MSIFHFLIEGCQIVCCNHQLTSGMKEWNQSRSDTIQPSLLHPLPNWRHWHSVCWNCTQFRIQQPPHGASGWLMSSPIMSKHEHQAQQGFSDHINLHDYDTEDIMPTVTRSGIVKEHAVTICTITTQGLNKKVRFDHRSQICWLICFLVDKNLQCCMY